MAILTAVSDYLIWLLICTSRLFSDVDIFFWCDASLRVWVKGTAWKISVLWTSAQFWIFFFSHHAWETSWGQFFFFFFKPATPGTLEKTLMLGKIEGGRRRGDRGWDGWMASPTRWTWVWASSGSRWWTGRPGVLRSMGSQRVGHEWATGPQHSLWVAAKGSRKAASFVPAPPAPQAMSVLDISVPVLSTAVERARRDPQGLSLNCPSPLPRVPRTHHSFLEHHSAGGLVTHGGARWPLGRRLEVGTPA